MIIDIINFKELIYWNNVSAICELDKSMIDHCFPFWRNIVSEVLDKIKIKNVVALTKNFFDDSDLLGGQVNAKRIKKQVKCMGRHVSGIFVIIFLNISIAAVKILNVSTQKLELEFVIDFG